MDNHKALTIVSALANGVNPLTGEVFAADSPYQSPDIVRALFAATRALGGEATAPVAAGAPSEARNRHGSTSNIGKPWSKENDQTLLAAFDQGRTPTELSRLLGRTLAGIEARLEKHGKLAPGQRKTSNRYPGNGAQTGA